VKNDPSVYGPAGVYTFRIRGELFHLIGSLLPVPPDQPAFAQIYIFDSDPQSQADRRMSHYPGLLDKPTLLALQNMVALHNPYFEAFKMASERLTQCENIALHLKTFDVPRLDRRLYNQPTASEIAVLMIGTGEELTSGSRDIVLQSRHGSLRRVSDLHSSYCPLRYPLLFPYGEHGWNLSMTHIRKFVTSAWLSADD